MQKFSPEPFIQLKALTKCYDEGNARRCVLEALDMNIMQGEIIVLVGRSGSGKSTLLNLLSGIDRPDAGQIKIGGLEISTLNETERTRFRRRHIGFIFQFFNLIPTLTVLENLLLPRALNGKMIGAEVDAFTLLDRVGLRNRAKAYPDTLSGGEQQRVAIARALIHDPMLVLADEPTGNLDEHTATEVLALLDELIRQRGKTLVMVTHSAEVVGLADRVMTVHDGKLVESAVNAASR